jgi:hypothetical protein
MDLELVGEVKVEVEVEVEKKFKWCFFGCFMLKVLKGL